MEVLYAQCEEVFQGEGHPDTILKSLSKDQTILLKALLNQITQGPCDQPKPTSPNELPLWNAWKGLKKKSPADCKREFIDLVVNSIPSPQELSDMASSFRGSEGDRARLQERLSSAQKALRLHGIGEISTTGKTLTSSYVMTGEESDGASEHETYGFDEDENPGEYESSHLFRSSSMPIHDHEFQEPSPLLQPATDRERREESRAPREATLAQQIEELARYSNNALTRLETLERDLAQLHRDIQAKEQRTYWLLVALSSVSIPCCILALWTVLRRK